MTRFLRAFAQGVLAAIVGAVLVGMAAERAEQRRHLDHGSTHLGAER